MKHNGLRMIWMANSPWAGTGYGVQSRHLLPAFKDMTEIADVLIFAFYGLQGGRIQYRLGNHTFRVWPTTTNDWGNDTIAKYALEDESDLVITLLDIWPLDAHFGHGFMWCPYAPIDIDPVPAAFTDHLRNAYLPIVYAKHASHELENLGIEHVYIPHGVQTSWYRPIPQMQRAYRRMLNWPDEALDGFIFGMVAANKGYPPRKAFPEVFEAFSDLRQQRDDVWLYVHTIYDDTQGGLDLVHMAKSFGIADRVLFANRHLFLSGAYTEIDLLHVYNSIDCLVSPSYSEGFGIPLIEAQACGVPVIATNAFAMTELVGAGWLVPWDHKLYMPVGGSYVMPNVDQLVGALRAALTDCSNPKTRAALRDRARQFAMQYDWQRVIDEGWRPLIQRLNRELTPRHYMLGSVPPAPPVSAAKELAYVQR